MRRYTMAGPSLAVALTVATSAFCLETTSAQDNRARSNRGYVETDLVVNKLVNGVPTLTDKNGIVHIAKFFDPNLQNAWGIGESAGSPFWVSDNASGQASLYNTQGAPQSLVVSIPTPSDPLHASGAPTGNVFNIAMAQQAFKISGFTKAGAATTAPALFLFATEDGTIVGWNPGVNPKGFDPAKAGTYGIIAIDNSANPKPTNGAVYKGLAIATDEHGATFLYATNFRAGTVEVYDADFKPVTSPGAFTDPKLPAFYAPFDIVPITINGKVELFVTYAVQDAAKHDDVAGQGHGVVDTFDLTGQMRMRFAQHDQLNSPWGVALTPPDFGELGGSLWIGNFGNGQINAFDPNNGKFISKVRQRNAQPIVIDGLWALRFGNGGNGGAVDTLYFTAGPNGETDGLFGSLTPDEQ